MIPENFKWKSRCRIPLVNGGFALVDESDFDECSEKKWYRIKAISNVECFYAVHAQKISGKAFPLYMHRLIMNPGPGFQVDHRDFNGLNNCRSNLRLCTQSQQNAHKRGGKNQSGFRGVYPTPEGKFRARITNGKLLRVGNKMTSLGTFSDPIEAAMAYDAAAIAMFGEFATLNFPIAKELALAA